MPASRPILLATLLLAACGTQKTPSQPETKAPEVPAPQPLPPPTIITHAPEVPVGGQPEASSVDPKSGQAAATLIERYYALIAARNYGEAYKLWGGRGQGSGKTLAEFRDEMAAFADDHVEVGAPGDSEGAAGSIYVEVPIHVTGRGRDGAPIDQRGKATLRRVNDVPGSTAAQRRWHIDRIELPG